MKQKTDVWQGTLGLMILRTLETMGRLSLNYGTLYPALLKLKQESYIASEWGVSENKRKAKYYRLTRAGKKRLAQASAEWEQTTEIVARFLKA